MPLDTTAPALRLGQEAFCVHQDGRISRTIVDRLGARFMVMERVRDPDTHNKNAYGLLDSGSTEAHFFDLPPAIEESKRRLRETIGSDRTSKRDERVAREYLAQIEHPNFPQEIRDQPIRDRSTPFGSDDGGAIEVKQSDVPQTYFSPGAKVWAVITPETHYVTLPGWRPRPYFVLETDVARVSFAPRLASKLSYDLGSGYLVRSELVCATEAEAREKLARVFAEETGGSIELKNIRCLSVMDEARAQSEQWDRIGREVSARMAYADKHF